MRPPPSTLKPVVLQLKLRLLEAEPVVWRRILVDDTSTLHQLHRMIQILMGWGDYHLYRFDVAGRRFDDPQDEPIFLDDDVGEPATGVTLRGLGLRKGDVFDYRYDFGDDWRIAIEVERRRQTRGQRWTLPWLLEGERAGPPEDCGGITGLAEIVAVFEPVSADQAGSGNDVAGWEDVGGLDGLWEEESDEDRERRELLEWLGDYDPARFDRRTVNHFLVLAQYWGALEE